MMRKMMMSERSKCVACTAIRKYVPAEGASTENDAVHAALMAGLMIGVGIEGTGLTPTFCEMHYKLIEEIGEKFSNGEVSTLRSREH